MCPLRSHNPLKKSYLASMAAVTTQHTQAQSCRASLQCSRRGSRSRVSGAVPVWSWGQDVFLSLTSLDSGGCLHQGLTALPVSSQLIITSASALPSSSLLHSLAPYFTRTRMITLNHVEDAKIESPSTILHFIITKKSPPLLCKRRGSQESGVRAWAFLLLKFSEDSE